LLNILMTLRQIQESRRRKTSRAPRRKTSRDPPI
jgi:hypothetical protein